MHLLPRPTSVILSDATRTLGRNVRRLIAPSLIVFIPGGILSLAVFRWTGAGDFVNLVFEDPASLQTLPPEALMEAAAPFFQAVATTIAIQVFASVFVFLACHRVVVSELEGAPVTSAGSMRFALRRLFPAMTAVVVAAVPTIAALLAGFTLWLGPASASSGGSAAVSLVGLLLLVVFLAPGLWLLTSFSMVTAVVATEGPGIAAALARSLRLVRGRRLQTLGYLLLVGLLGGVAVQMIELVAVPVALAGVGGTGLFIASVLGIGLQGLIVAAIAVPVTLWYLDLRARLEGVVSDGPG